MSIGTKIKKVDFFKVVPEKMKEASYLGLCLSMTFFLLLVLMILN